MVFYPMICFRLVLLRKTIRDFVLSNVSLKVLQRISLYQCLFAFLTFGSEGLYVTKKGILFAWIGLGTFKSDPLSRLSTLLI